MNKPFKLVDGIMTHLVIELMQVPTWNLGTQGISKNYNIRRVPTEIAKGESGRLETNENKKANEELSST